MAMDDDGDGDGDDDSGRELEPECASELKEVRRSLLEDYRISPLVERSCRHDVKVHCDNIPRRKVFHCLMDVARHQYRAVSLADDGAKREKLSKECYSEVCFIIILIFINFLNEIIALSSIDAEG